MTAHCRAVPPFMSKLEDLAERVERLVLRHEELQRTNALLQQQLAVLGSDGALDSLLAVYKREQAFDDVHLLVRIQVSQQAHPSGTGRHQPLALGLVSHAAYPRAPVGCRPTADCAQRLRRDRPLKTIRRAFTVETPRSRAICSAPALP